MKTPEKRRVVCLFVLFFSWKMKLIDCIRPFVNKVHRKASPVAISFHVWSHLISPYLLTGIEMEQVIFINNRLKNKLERVSLHANLFTFVLFLIFTRGLRLIQTAQKLRIIVQIVLFSILVPSATRFKISLRRLWGQDLGIIIRYQVPQCIANLSGIRFIMFHTV